MFRYHQSEIFFFAICNFKNNENNYNFFKKNWKIKEKSPEKYNEGNRNLIEENK